MKKLLVLALALILALGCVSALAEEATEYDIRALIWKYDDTYGSSVRQAMMAAAEEIGAELGITINLTMYDAADDMAKQVEQATILVGEKPDFVIINLAEVASGQQLVDMFTEAGIPFLFYNKEPSAETVQSVVVDSGSIFIGTTPREAGDMQGEILADMYNADPASVDLNGDGVVHFVEFMGEPNNPEAIARTQYSEETAIALGVPLEAVLEDPIVANWDTAQANERMTATWAAHPEIEVVFCNNDDMATGVIAAMNAFNYNTGREGDPALVVIGVDATDAAYEAIAAGKMTATVKQDGDAMGYANVRIAVNYLQTGTWLDGLDYTLAEDGYSVRIPYAKITADDYIYSMQQMLNPKMLNRRADSYYAGDFIIHNAKQYLYAGKTTSLEELADGATVAIPNDGTNEARALLLLEAQGLIKLNEGVTFTATKLDIAENPKNLDIQEIEAAQLPRSLQDVDLAVINGNYAIQAGLKVVKEGNEETDATKALIAALQSDTVREFIDATYAGAVIAKF